MRLAAGPPPACFLSSDPALPVDLKHAAHALLQGAHIAGHGHAAAELPLQSAANDKLAAAAAVLPLYHAGVGSNAALGPGSGGRSFTDLLSAAMPELNGASPLSLDSLLPVPLPASGAVSEEAATMSSESDHPSTSDGGSPLKAGAWTPRAGGARSDGGGNAVPQPPAGGGDGSGGGGGGGGGGAG
eukprot:SM005076S17646  [mRNA]  locus=s5076:33:1092:+ [translate_table: standard]